MYTLQHQAGCTNDVVRNNALTLAAEWHAEDMINNRNINDDTGSDGSTPQDRANAAGFRGKASEKRENRRRLVRGQSSALGEFLYRGADLGRRGGGRRPRCR